MKDKLNIWTIYQFASTPKIPGSERTYEFAKAFVSKGHAVTLWTSSFGHWGKVETIREKNRAFDVEVEEGIKIISLKTRPLYHRNDYRRFLNMIYFAYALFRTSKKINMKPDVIIASYPSPFAALTGYCLSKKYEAKFILEIRDLWPQNWIERGAFSKYHPFILILSILEKYLYSKTCFFVSVLPYFSEYLNAMKLRAKKILWIPNGINLFEFKKATIQKSSNKHVNRIISAICEAKKRGNLNVIYVGGLGVGNRVDCIVKAAHILKSNGIDDISFFIIGEGHSKEELKKYVSRYCPDIVTILSAIPRKDVPRILSQSDIGILCLNYNPIYRYGVNLHKIYDYMAAELPIIFSGKVRNNLVESAKAGISVPPASPEKIAYALVQIKNMSEDERVSMGKKGHEYLSDNFDITNKLVKKYMDIIYSD
jgi:glycosyltransferase involved in cell wall biosynthesis